MELVSKPYTACRLTLPLALSPAWSGRELDGARAAVDDMLLKYNADIGAVLLAHARLRFATAPACAEPEDGGGAYVSSPGGAPLGRIVGELPAVHVRVSMDALLFAPRLGALLSGRVNSTGPGHLSCLVAGLFGASLLLDQLAGGYAYEADDGGPAQGRWLATAAHAAAAAAARAAAASAAASAAGAAAGKKRRRDEASSASAEGASAASAAVTHNRILALNPGVLQVGAVVTFRLTALSLSSGVLSMQGSLVDAEMALAPPPPPPPPSQQQAARRSMPLGGAAASSSSAAAAAAAGMGSPPQRIRGGSTLSDAGGAAAAANAARSARKAAAAAAAAAESAAAAAAAAAAADDAAEAEPAPEADEDADEDDEARRRRRKAERKARRRSEAAAAAAEASAAAEDEPAPPARKKAKREA